MVQLDMPESSGIDKEEQPPDTPRTKEQQGANIFQSAWEKQVHAKYGKNRKVPRDPVNSKEFPTWSTDNVEPTPITNI